MFRGGKKKKKKRLQFKDLKQSWVLNPCFFLYPGLMTTGTVYVMTCSITSACFHSLPVARKVWSNNIAVFIRRQ